MVSTLTLTPWLVFPSLMTPLEVYGIHTRRGGDTAPITCNRGDLGFPSITFKPITLGGLPIFNILRPNATGQAVRHGIEPPNKADTQLLNVECSQAGHLTIRICPYTQGRELSLDLVRLELRLVLPDLFLLTSAILSGLLYYSRLTSFAMYDDGALLGNPTYSCCCCQLILDMLLFACRNIS